MDWERLRLFHTVAEAGSFTEAARRLGGSQSALSRQMQALEAQLGAALFHRHARGLVLTDEGEQLLAAAHDVVARIDSAERSIISSRSRPTGELRITTTVTFGSTWLARELKDFHDLHPDIRVVLVLADEDLDLSQRQADVAIRFHPPVQTDLIQRSLTDVHYRVCASQDYLRRHGTPLIAQDLDNHQLLKFGGTAADPVRSVNWLLEAGAGARKRQPVLTINTLFGIQQAVEAGLGIAVLPSYLWTRSAVIVPILPELVGTALKTYLVYPKELRRSIRVAVLRDFLINRMTDERLNQRQQPAAGEESALFR